MRTTRAKGAWPALDVHARAAPAAVVAEQLWGWAIAETDETGPRGYPAWVRAQLPGAASGGLAPTVIAGLLAAAGQNTVEAPIRLLEPFAVSRHRSVRLALAQNLPLAVRPRNEPQAVSVLERLAQDRSPVVRDWAVFGLGRQLFAQRTRRMSAVFAALHDPSPRVRVEARLCVREFAWSTTGDEWQRDIRGLMPS